MYVAKVALPFAVRGTLVTIITSEMRFEPLLQSKLCFEAECAQRQDWRLCDLNVHGCSGWAAVLASPIKDLQLTCCCCCCCCCLDWGYVRITCA